MGRKDTVTLTDTGLEINNGSRIRGIEKYIAEERRRQDG